MTFRRFTIPARAVLPALLCALSIGLSPARADAQPKVPPRRGPLAIDSRQSIDREALSAAFTDRVGDVYGLEGLVIIVDSCGPDPETYFDEALMSYALAPRPGEMVDDAIAWLVCTDPPEGRFAYSVNNRYKTYLDQSAVELAMVEAIGADDPSTAALDGIAAVVRLLDRAPRPTPVIDPNALLPSTSSGSRLDGRWLTLLAFGAALGWWGWRRRKRLATLAARAPAPKDLRRLRMTTDDLSARLLGDHPTLTELLAVCEPFGESIRIALLRRHEGMSRRVHEIRRQVEALEGRYALRPEGEADPVTLAAERKRLEDLLVEADALSGYAKRLERELRHAGILHERAERLVDEARADIAAARETYSRSAAPLADDPSLRLPDAFEATALAESRVAAALRALSDGRRLQAGRRAEDASDLVTRTARAAGAIARCANRIEAARNEFEREARHAPSTWWDVKGHGSEAEESLVLAVGLLRAIVSAPEDRLGDDAVAGFVSNIARLDVELVRAIALCDAIDARLADLEAAREEVEKVVDDVRSAIVSVTERDDDESAVEAGVERTAPERSGEARDTAVRDTAVRDAAARDAAERAGAALAEAESAILDDPPDWIAARHALLVADRSADLAMAAMDGPPDDSTRRGRWSERFTALLASRKRQIKLAHGDAEADVTRAERFVAVHQGEIGPRAIRRVDDARAALETAIEAARRAEGDEAGRGGDEALAAYRLAREIAGDAWRRLREAFLRVEEPRSPTSPRSAGAGANELVPVKARRSPFPARFGDWGEVRTVSPETRKGRWGTRRREAGHGSTVEEGW